MNTNSITFNKVEAAVKAANKIRLENKNNWYQIEFLNTDTQKTVKIKAYNTWIQLSDKPIFSNSMDLSTKEFKENLNKGLNKIS